MTDLEKMAADSERLRSGIQPGMYRLCGADTFSWPADSWVVEENSNLRRPKEASRCLHWRISRFLDL